MTEAEWLACEDPDQLVLWNHLGFTSRKLRLFAVSCCRVMQWRFTDPRAWAAVEAVEAHVEGRLSCAELSPIAADAHTAWSDTILRRDGRPVRNTKGGKLTALAAWKLAHPLASDAVLPGDLKTSVDETIGIVRQGVKQSKATQAALLRDIFGNPFRPIAFSPEWRTDTAVSLARTMYDAREFSAMPILADSLQDAGCDNEDILTHCREPGTHVRGCWVCDLVLGKQ